MANLTEAHSKVICDDKILNIHHETEFAQLKVQIRDHLKTIESISNELNHVKKSYQILEKEFIETCNSEHYKFKDLESSYFEIEDECANLKEV